MSYRFHPPRTNAFVVGAVNLLLPAFMPLHDRLVQVVVDDKEWERLEALRHRRALLVVNHPSETEPVVMAWLARRLGHPFYFVATHEIFHGARGWLINRIGAFTIRRGWPDRVALRMARTVLAERDGRLVIFPEGETHMQNDRVLPLHPGAAHIALTSVQRLAETGRSVSLPILPLAVRYRCVSDPLPELGRGLARLERCLGIAARDEPLADRLARAGLVVLGGVESEYGVRPPPGTTVDERITGLYRHIARRVSHVLHVRVPEEASVHLGMRALFNAAFDYLDGLARGRTPYERRLHARRVLAARACLNDLSRVQNFMAISGECLRPPLSAECLGEVLFRLEKEVYGTARTRPWREAVVRIGEPLEAAERLPECRGRRGQAVRALTAELERALRELLDSTRELGTPLRDGWPAPASGGRP